MEICRKGFAGIITDNDEIFLAFLKGVVEATDEYSSLEIYKTPCAYKFRIAPSTAMYINPLLKEILKLNNMFGIKIDMSKSIKSSCVINFSIDIN